LIKLIGTSGYLPNVIGLSVILLFLSCLH